jgi:predicted ATP-grasp superfamily ATP-dependent carboligase
MASKVQILSDFIVTKATNQNLSITQVVNVDNATIVSAIPQEHRDKITPMILRKAKQTAVHNFINQKAQQLADDQTFKDSITAIIPELVITQDMIRKIIIQKIKELRE